MKRKIFTVIGLVAFAIGAYSFMANDEGVAPKEQEVPNIKQLVQDYSIGNVEAQSVSITSQELIVTDKEKNELTYDLPQDEFFVSVAPYVENTHPCAVHSLTGCRGEMADKEFSVYIEDTEGNVIIDKTLKSQSNGFIDLWLPRDKTYRVTIAHDGKTAESEFSTFESDNTCITNIQLTDSKSA
jgi:hypothetical protein